MHVSSLVMTVRDRLRTNVRENIQSKKTESNEFIGLFFLAQFNIIKLESVLKQPFTDLKIPILSWPLRDLPTNRLKKLKAVCQAFKLQEFDYIESFYGKQLWGPILKVLFQKQLSIEREYSLTNIETHYHNVRTDFVVKIPGKKFAPPLLFVELSREQLNDVTQSHKDEPKMGYSLGASLLKIIGMNWNRDLEFLSKLRVYGILPGATGYDLCMVYPVFPNPDRTEFYFVLDCSKKHLRFQIFKDNDFSANQRFCEGEADQMHNEPEYLYKPNSVEIPPVDTGAEPLIIRNEDLKDTATLEPQERTSLKEIECFRLFEEGHINSRALKVLERVAQLVQVQADLLSEMEDTPNPDLRFKYDKSRCDLMISSRTSHSRSSPPRNRWKRASASFNVDNSPSKVPRLTVEFDPQEQIDFEALLSTLGGGDCGKEYVNSENIANALEKTTVNIIDPSPTTIHKPKKTIFIYKRISKHEISIYNNEIIRSSPYFPKYIGSSTDYEDKEYEDDVRLELEEIMPGTSFDFAVFFGYTNGLFGAKFLVDIFGALMTLHSIGYIHGDVTPANVGYNEELGIWQLFDFDNSRPIEEAAQGKGEYHGTPEYKSAHYAQTGKYGPFDDFVGALKTFSLFNFHYEFYAKLSDNFESEDDRFDPFFDDLTRKFGPLSQKDLHRLYLMAVKLLWDKCNKNPKEPSIINSKRILTNSYLIKT